MTILKIFTSTPNLSYATFRIKKEVYLEILGCFSATLYKVGH